MWTHPSSTSALWQIDIDSVFSPTLLFLLSIRTSLSLCLLPTCFPCLQGPWYLPRSSILSLASLVLDPTPLPPKIPLPFSLNPHSYQEVKHLKPVVVDSLPLLLAASVNQWSL
ncbi:hypothetical protein BDV23DRAFT_59575 [Aspergillus alliaceus]|uniref:Uncharacterized protein n=1 Tax=Petromyces alliaceus TaxID=209559 RepID=A0A5N7CE37_PETAA|nr:hypothetical protein BDV23DRAFT_59575 [Aspergillus alliaceus]